MSYESVLYRAREALNRNRSVDIDMCVKSNAIVDEAVPVNTKPSAYTMDMKLPECIMDVKLPECTMDVKLPASTMNVKAKISEVMDDVYREKDVVDIATRANDELDASAQEFKGKKLEADDMFSKFEAFNTDDVDWDTETVDVNSSADVRVGEACESGSKCGWRRQKHGKVDDETYVGEWSLVVLVPDAVWPVYRFSLMVREKANRSVARWFTEMRLARYCLTYTGVSRKAQHVVVERYAPLDTPNQYAYVEARYILGTDTIKIMVRDVFEKIPASSETNPGNTGESKRASASDPTASSPTPTTTRKWDVYHEPWSQTDTTLELEAEM
jgi:hypothetical protein